MNGKVILNEIIIIVLGINIINIPFFFSFMALLGLDYENSESSAIYSIYLAALFVLVCLFYFYSVCIRGVQKSELYVFSLILCYVVIHFIWVLFDSGSTSLVPAFLISSFAIGFVGVIAGIVTIKLELFEALIKRMELLFVIQALGILFYSVINTLSGNKVATLGGATYQALSYYSAFTMGMLMIYGLILPVEFRFKFARSVLYKFFLYMLTFVCALGVFVGAGRGAFLLMIIYLIFVLYRLVNTGASIKRKDLLEGSVKLLLVLGVIAFFAVYFWEKDFVQHAFQRSTQYMSSESLIDLRQGSSGRDKVYSIAFDYILDKPFLGYGPFGVRDKAIHAHNVFLELWLQFGLFALFILPLGVYCLVVRMNRMKNWYKIWSFGLVLYPLVMIQFSGSYVTVSNLWFVIGLLVMQKKQLATRV